MGNVNKRDLLPAMVSAGLLNITKSAMDNVSLKLSNVVMMPVPVTCKNVVKYVCIHQDHWAQVQNTTENVVMNASTTLQDVLMIVQMDTLYAMINVLQLIL